MPEVILATVEQVREDLDRLSGRIAALEADRDAIRIRIAALEAATPQLTARK